MAKITKKQHYVWQYYLKAWQRDKALWCLSQRDNKLFKTKTSSVACERYFYEASHLSDADIEIIVQFIENCPSPALREANKTLLRIYIIPTLLSESNKSTENQEYISYLEELRRTAFEDYHGMVEQNAQPIIDSLRRGDPSFLNDARLFSIFCHYMINQMFRTPRLNLIASRLNNDLANTMNRSTPLFGAMLSTNIAFSYLSERELYRIEFLRCDSESEFITSDQPVFNLNNASDEDMRLYYPLSPGLSIIFEKGPSSKTTIINNKYLRRLNQITYDNSNMFVFGSTCASVAHFVGSKKGQVVPSIEDMLSQEIESPP